MALYVCSALALLIYLWALYRCKAEDGLQGWNEVLGVVLASCGAAGACWPMRLALNSPHSHGVEVFAATLTITPLLLVAWLAIPLMGKQNPPTCCGPTHERRFGRPVWPAAPFAAAFISAAAGFSLSCTPSSEEGAIRLFYLTAGRSQCSANTTSFRFTRPHALSRTFRPPT